MANNSNIVLRWEIDNAAATLATGKAESGVFKKAGFKWTAAIERYTESNGKAKVQYTLHCDTDRKGAWKCETSIEICALHVNGDWKRRAYETCFNYDENSGEWLDRGYTFWEYFESDQYFLVNGKVTLEFRINIISSDRGQSIAVPSMFDAPNRMSNVILNIGEKKLHVYKELLAFHSPVFETLFFGNFAENGKEEVEIKDVVYEEFLDLLHLISGETMEITDRTVSHILKLTDQFQIERFLEHSKKYLAQTMGIDVMKKLLLADRYNLDSLRDQCLASFTNVTDLLAKLKCPEADEFSKDLNAAILDRIKKL